MAVLEPVLLEHDLSYLGMTVAALKRTIKLGQQQKLTQKKSTMKAAIFLIADFTTKNHPYFPKKSD